MPLSGTGLFCSRSSGGRTWGLRTGSPAVCGVLILQLCYLCLASTGPPSGNARCLDRNFWWGWTAHQLQKDIGDGLPDMSHGWRELGGSLWETGNAGGDIIQGASTWAVTTPGVRGGLCNGVAGSTSPGSAWDNPGSSVGYNSKYTIPQAIQGLFT